jgi:hypothetical protein
MVGKAVQHFQKDLEKEIGHAPKKQRKEMSNVDPKMNKYLALIAGNDKYKMPKTISIPQTSIDASSEAVDPTVPQYKPTPISQLMKKQKPKYVIPYLEDDASESEYDPSTNFSTDQRTKSPPEFEYKPTPLNKNAKIFVDPVGVDEYDPTAEYDPTSEYDPSGEYEPSAEYKPTHIPDLTVDICSEPEGDFSDDNDSTEAAKSPVHKPPKAKKTLKAKAAQIVEKPVKEKPVKDDLVSQIIFASDATKSMSISQVKKHSDGSIDFISKKLSKKKTSKGSKEKVVDQKSEKGLFDLFKKSDKSSIKPVASDKPKKIVDGVKTKVLERKDSGSQKHQGDKKKIKTIEGVSASHSDLSKKSKSENKETKAIEKHQQKHSSHSDSPKCQYKDLKHKSENATLGDKHKTKIHVLSGHSGKSHQSHHRSESQSSKSHSSKSSAETEIGAKKHVSSKQHGHDSSNKSRNKGTDSQDHKENLNTNKLKHRSDSKGNQPHSHQDSKSGSSKSNHSATKIKSPGSFFGFGTDFLDSEIKQSHKSHHIEKTRSPRSPSHKSVSMNDNGFDSDSDPHETTNVEVKIEEHRHVRKSSVKSESSSQAKLRLSGGEKRTFYRQDKHSISGGSSKQMKYSHSRGNSGSFFETFETSDDEIDMFGDDDLPSLQIDTGIKDEKYSWDDPGAGTSRRKQIQVKEKGHKSGKSHIKSGLDSNEPFIISSEEDSPKKNLKRSRLISSGSGSKSSKGSLSTFDLFGDDSDNGDENVKFSNKQKSRSSETYSRVRKISGDGYASHVVSTKRRKTVENSSSDGDGDNFLSLGNDQLDVQASDGSNASDARYVDSGGDGLDLDLDDDEDGEDLYDECLKIFNESPKKRPTGKV